MLQFATLYILSINIDDEVISSTLFSCPKCEVPLTALDYAQLGMQEREGTYLKRLEGVVIDAKVVVIFKETSKNPERHDVMHGVPGPKMRMVSNSPTQTAIRLFAVQLVRKEGYKRIVMSVMTAGLFVECFFTFALAQ